MREWRIGHGESQENIHGRFAGQADIAHAFGDTQAAVDFHGAGVATLHFGELDGGGVAFDQRAMYAAPAEIESQREADRSRADDEDLRVRHAIHGPFHPWMWSTPTRSLQDMPRSWRGAFIESSFLGGGACR